MILSEDKLIEALADLSPQKDARGENFIIDCPACGHRECSVSIRREGHVWGCFRLNKCGEKGNIYSLLDRLGILNKYVRRRLAADSEFIKLEELLPESTKVESSLDLNIEELKTIPAPFGFRRITSNDPYLDGRGFQSYDYCEVGRTDLDKYLKKDYIIFLVRDEGEIKGYVARHTMDKKKIEQYNKEYKEKTGVGNKIKRYRNATGVDFSKLLYGYDEIKEVKPVVLVEGIFDKHAVDVKLELQGQENPALYTCATFKAAVTEDQIIKLLKKGIKDVILFYDPDVIRIIQRNAHSLSLFFNVKVILSPTNKDPDEMSQEEVIVAFENHVYTPQQIVADFTPPPVFQTNFRESKRVRNFKETSENY